MTTARPISEACSQALMLAGSGFNGIGTQFLWNPWDNKLNDMHKIAHNAVNGMSQFCKSNLELLSAMCLLRFAAVGLAYHGASSATSCDQEKNVYASTSQWEKSSKPPSLANDKWQKLARWMHARSSCSLLMAKIFFEQEALYLWVSVGDCSCFADPCCFPDTEHHCQQAKFWSEKASAKKLIGSGNY